MKAVIGLGKKWKGKNKPKAKKNEIGFNKLLKATSTARDQYEDEYGFAIDYDEIQTPEGLPSFSEFIDEREASRAYNEADPLWKYTKTTRLPFGLAWQRWRGAKTSYDGKNYRSPYMTPIEERRAGPAARGSVGGSGVSRDGKFTLGEYGVGGTGTRGYKKGHREQMENRTLLQRIKALPGTILPPLNMLSGGASASGGRYLTTLPYLASLYGSANYATSGFTFDDNLAQPGDTAKANALAAGSMALLYPTQSRVVIPTGGFMRNPYNRGARDIRREARRENKSIDAKLERGSRAYERLSEKEKRAFERNAKLYEKKYGFLPTIPSNTMSPTTSRYDQPTTRRTTSSKRGENRNPIFLDKGGKLYFKK